MASLFAEDVTYHTPTLTTDLHGRELTLRYLAEGTRIVDDLEYTDQVSDDERLILFWTGLLDQREISGATVLADEAEGLIGDITVLQRPWGVTANFRDGILPALADVVPPPAWQLDGFTVVAQKLARTARDQPQWREISISTGGTVWADRGLGGWVGDPGPRAHTTLASECFLDTDSALSMEFSQTARWGCSGRCCAGPRPAGQRHRSPAGARSSGWGCVVSFDFAGRAVLVGAALRARGIDGLLIRQPHRDRGDMAGLPASPAESLEELTWLITAVMDVDAVTAIQSYDQPGNRAGQPPRDVQRCAPAP
jgi:hypothetical protein